MTDDKKNDVYENGKYLSLRLRSLHKVVFTIFREAVSDVVLPFSIKEITFGLEQGLSKPN